MMASEIDELKRQIKERDEEIKKLKELMKIPDALTSHSIGELECRSTLTNKEINRYGRQLILPEIGVKGQLQLASTSVLIVGAGGLGCPAAVYLAAAGVGRIGFVDYDAVELTNLHRQILHSEVKVGVSKSSSAAAACSHQTCPLNTPSLKPPSPTIQSSLPSQHTQPQTNKSNHLAKPASQHTWPQTTKSDHPVKPASQHTQPQTTKSDHQSSLPLNTPSLKPPSLTTSQACPLNTPSLKPISPTIQPSLPLNTPGLKPPSLTTQSSLPSQHTQPQTNKSDYPDKHPH